MGVKSSIWTFTIQAHALNSYTICFDVLTIKMSFVFLGISFEFQMCDSGGEDMYQSF